jgi:uncharacterized cupredoxin-like copper-binding protein
MPKGRGLAIAAAAALLVGASGCELKDDGDNLVAGKKNFVAKCGSCHTLKRAGTTGVTGPNLDEAFAQARASGFGQSTFEGIVYGQILHPNKYTQIDPNTGKPTTSMPGKLFTGEDAQDVAAYVASAVSKPGEDKGQLGAAGVKRSNEVAKEQDGKLAIPADPGGALAYQFGSAEAQAGSIEIDSQNKSSVDHNIAIEGSGVNEEGEVVKNGAVSKITADVKPGDYTFFCSVPGHREGGMEGKLTVK